MLLKLDITKEYGSEQTTETIMLTTKCSAKCSHCSFSNPNLKQLFLSIEQINKILERSASELIVISGGEPFEHPAIETILERLCEEKKPFRIATGGHINFDPWKDKLLKLLEKSKGFKGISIGTDVLTTRVNQPHWIPNWKNNLAFLCQYQIPFSITLTLGTDLTFSWFDLSNWNNFFQRLPEFFYIRYSDENLLAEFKKNQMECFKNVPHILDLVEAS